MQIRLNSTLRERVGRRVFDLDPSDGVTVRRAVAMTAEEAPALMALLLDKNGNLQPNFVIFRNGRNIEFADGLNTLLRKSDTLDIFPKTGAQKAFATS
jgi:molybdopterin converting factor small subunit